MMIDVPLSLAAGCKITEEDFQDSVEALAEARDFLVYHAHQSRRDCAGYPDLHLVNEQGRVIYAELKVPGGRVERAQAQWLTFLAASGTLEVYLWRPKDWRQIVRILDGDERFPGVCPALPHFRPRTIADELRELTGRRGRGLVR